MKPSPPSPSSSPSPLSRRRLTPLALAALLSLSSCKDAKDTNPDTNKQGEGTPEKQPGDSPKSVTPPPAPKPLEEVAPMTVDSAPIAEVGAVVMTAQLPTGTLLQDLVPVIDKFAPGTSMMLKLQLPPGLAELAGMSLEGAKLDAPFSIVVVNPALDEQPLALLVQVEDLAKLQANAASGGRELRERDGLALIGPAAVVAAAEDVAFNHLTKYPDHTEIVIYPAQLAESLAPQIAQAMAAMNAQLSATNPGVQMMMQMYVDGLLGMTKQTERFVISVSAGKTTTDLFARVYPRAGTQLASFVAAQAPSTHPLLSKLPNTSAQTILMTGEMHAGAATPALIEFGIAAMNSMYADAMPVEVWSEIMTAWAESLDGQYAMSVNLSLPGGTAPPGMSLQGLIGASDAAGMRKAWRDMMGALAKAQANNGDGGGLDMMGMKVSVEYGEDVVTHEGVGVDLYTTNIDMQSVPEDQRAIMEAAGSARQSMNFASFDNVGALATADEDSQTMRALIDAARGKNPGFTPAGGLASALATSTERGESLFTYFDIGSFTPAGAAVPFRVIVMAIGKQGDALSMRLSLQD